MSINKTFTISGTGAQAWVPVDFNNRDFNVGIVISKNPGNLTVNVEVTHENVLSVTATPTQVVQVDSVAAAVELVTSITTPVTAIRFNCPVFLSGTAVASILQTGYTT